VSFVPGLRDPLFAAVEAQAEMLRDQVAAGHVAAVLGCEAEPHPVLAGRIGARGVTAETWLIEGTHDEVLAEGRRLQLAQWLPYLGSLSRPWPPVDPLTPREREVAGLAASGMQSKQIAARLTVSVRTVDAHLRNAYAKTGAGNRVQLANWLRARGPGWPQP
jgi:DNA-binding CsgD family transcriptional regulator